MKSRASLGGWCCEDTESGGDNNSLMAVTGEGPTVRFRFRGLEIKFSSRFPEASTLETLVLLVACGV
jgi:hypothetical protein